MSITLHKGDLPDGLSFGPLVAMDAESMGLKNHRDRLCLVQLSAGDGTVHLVQFAPTEYNAPNLSALLTNPDVTKIFHFARFDVSIMKYYLDVICAPVYCTKTASRLARTYTDKHGLRDVCKELLDVDLSKQHQSSDWGTEELTKEQKQYAANDVLYLHRIREKLDAILIREGRIDLAQACFDFIPHRAALDLAGWGGLDIFAH